MRFSRAQRRETLEESESYYISMTDMMVGVLFIFIIMLSFFALQYRSSMANLTQAKDAQTTALLKVATALQKEDIAAEVDHDHHVVCLPASALVAGDEGKRCFAYSNTPTTPNPNAAASQVRRDIVDFVQNDLRAAKVQASGDEAGGVLSFAADRLFLPNSAALSPDGEAIAGRVAASLAARLPCYGYGAPTTGCGGPKMSVVNVVSSAGFDAFTEQGRQAAALALQRGVAFHQALTAAQPILGKLTDLPPGQAGAEPLLRVASYGQSQAAAPPAGSGQTIAIQFVPAP